MTPRSDRPPRVAERLLEAVLGRGARAESIAGDLHEEYARIVDRTSSFRAAGWYCRQALRIGGGHAVQSLARRLGRAPRPVTRSPIPSGDSIMRTLGLEARRAFKALAQRPALSAFVVLTLAVGLGANAAIFALIDSLVLRPYPFSGIERLTLVSETAPTGDQYRRETTAPANFLDWKRQADAFDLLVATDWWDVNLVGRDEPERVQGMTVSADFFTLAGVQLSRGRAFAENEEIFGRHRVVVLGHGLWQRRFGGDPSIIGQTVNLNGEAYGVIGVAPEGFDFPMGAEVWAPLAFDAHAAAVRTAHHLTVMGRLAPGRSIADAQAQMTVIAERLQRDHPDTNRDRGARVYTLAAGMGDPGVPPILSLWQASAGFVLLIACANIANLLLARGAQRQREIAIRLAIGASRARVVRELLVESLLLGVAAIPVSLFLAWLGLTAIRSYMPARIARFVAGWDAIGVVARVVGAAIALALGTAVVFGLVSALQASRPRVSDALKEGTRTATAGAARQRLRHALVIAEIALALPLLVACGLAALGASRFINGPQGYDSSGVLSMQLVLSEARYRDDGSRRRFVRESVDRLTAVAGVQATSAVNVMPAFTGNSIRPIEIDGRPNPDPVNPPTVDYRVATPRIFETLGIPLLRGRALTDADRESTQPVAVVSQSLARTYWPDADPIGRRVKVANGPWLTVVGICGDVIHDWFGRRNYPTLYRPYEQAPSQGMALLARTASDPASLASSAQAAVHAVDPTQPVFDVMTMKQALKDRTLGLQFLAGVMGVFGAFALLLAVVGVYGVMGYLVTQRTHEIGVRMALGATRADVLRMTVGQTARLAAIGVGVGALLSVALGRAIEAGLVGAATSDLRMIAALAMALGAAALLAGYVPALRAASIDPVVALRTE